MTRTITKSEAAELKRHGYLERRRDGALCGLFRSDAGTVLEPVEVVDPKPGDVVQVIGDDAYYATKDGQRGVIDMPHYGPDLCMVVFGPSAFRPHSGEYVSVSGGPCPAIPPTALEYLGTTEQRFWAWQQTAGGHDMRGAGMGVDYMATVNLWGWRGNV